MTSGNYPSSRWLRWLWSVNAVLLFAVLLIGIYSFLFPIGWRSERDIEPVPVQSDGSGELRSRAVRMSPPLHILGDETRLIEVRYGDGFSPSYGIDGGRGRADPLVNIIFLGTDGSARALLAQPAFISDRLVPRRDADSAQTWLAFGVAVEDTDGDGLLDERDLIQVLITDLDGGNPRGVFERPRRVTRMGRFGADLAISYLRSTSDANARDEDLSERMAVYRIGTDSLEELDQLGNTLEGVERTLAR